jgi:hypothetical protein
VPAQGLARLIFRDAIKDTARFRPDELKQVFTKIVGRDPDKSRTWHRIEGFCPDHPLGPNVSQITPTAGKVRRLSPWRV